MSSSYVRTQFKDFLAANAPDETLIDLTAQFDDLDEVLEQSGIVDSPWLGIDFVGSDEVPITIGSSNTSGKYREEGAVYLHVVDIAKLGVSDSILSRAETLIGILRGQRIGTIFVESITPVNFGAGAALSFEDGYMSGSFIVAYQNDKDF